MRLLCSFDALGLPKVSNGLLFEEKDREVFHRRVEKLKIYVDKVCPSNRFLQIGNRLLWTKATYSKYRDDMAQTVLICVIEQSHIEIVEAMPVSSQLEIEVSKFVGPYVEKIIQRGYDITHITTLFANAAYLYMQEREIE